MFWRAPVHEWMNVCVCVCVCVCGFELTNQKRRKRTIRTFFVALICKLLCTDDYCELSWYPVKTLFSVSQVKTHTHTHKIAQCVCVSFSLSLSMYIILFLTLFIVTFSLLCKFHVLTVIRMPTYSKHPIAGLFFVNFLVIVTFFLLNIFLAIVFLNYQNNMKVRSPELTDTSSWQKHGGCLVRLVVSV